MNSDNFLKNLYKDLFSLNSLYEIVRNIFTVMIIGIALYIFRVIYPITSIYLLLFLLAVVGVLVYFCLPIIFRAIKLIIVVIVSFSPIPRHLGGVDTHIIEEDRRSPMIFRCGSMPTYKCGMKKGTVKFLDEHKLDLLLAAIFAILFGFFYEGLKNITLVTILLFVPLLIILLLFYNVRKKDEITLLIKSLKSEKNRYERRSTVKKLIKLVKRTVKGFVIWRVWSAAIADLERCMSVSNELDPDVRHWIATAIGEIGGTSAVKALTRAMGEEDPFARLGVTDALARQGSRALKEVIEFSTSDNPLVRLSVATVLVSIGKDDPMVESLLAQLKNDSDKRVRDVVKDNWKKHL